MSLKFSDTTDKLGLIQDCESKVFGNDDGAISGNALLLKQFTRYINNAYSSLTNIILESDTRWQWDDSNFTDYPIGETDLVAGQQDYTLDVTHMSILAVYAKDSAGKFYPLKHIDEYDLKQDGIAPTEFMSTDGAPMYYDNVAGNAVKLYPAPATGSVTTSNGLRVSFQRPPSYFVSTDTTKVPGVPATFHKYLPLRACYEYAADNSMTEKSQLLKQRMDEEEQAIRYYYNKRNKDEKSRLKAKVSNFK